VPEKMLRKRQSKGSTENCVVSSLKSCSTDNPMKADPAENNFAAERLAKHSKRTSQHDPVNPTRHGADRSTFPDDRNGVIAMYSCFSCPELTAPEACYNLGASSFSPNPPSNVSGGIRERFPFLSICMGT
jgi:hypothetical protein